MKQNDSAVQTIDQSGMVHVDTVQAVERQREVEAAVMLAKKFPRNSLDSYAKLMESASRRGFAEIASYAFPRGGKTVFGPSINIAKEAARLLGNIRHGIDIIEETEETVRIQAWAWDMENNTRVSKEDEFKKLIFRKKDGWIKPDERDLRELVNRRGSLALRNCLLDIIPRDYIDDALAKCKETKRKGTESSPQETLKGVVIAFKALGVSSEMIEGKLNHPLAECSVDEIEELREIYKSITSGDVSRDKFFSTTKTPTSVIDVDELQTGDAKAHQEHNSTNTLKPEESNGLITKDQAAAIYDRINGAKKSVKEKLMPQLLAQFKITEIKELNEDFFPNAIEFLDAWIG